MQAATRSLVDLSVNSGNQTPFPLGAARSTSLEAHERRWEASSAAPRTRETLGCCQMSEGSLKPQVSLTAETTLGGVTLDLLWVREGCLSNPPGPLFSSNVLRASRRLPWPAHMKAGRLSMRIGRQMQR